MKSVKICVGYHKPSLLLTGDSFVPVWCGKDAASLPNQLGENISENDAKWLEEHCVGDNTGENISKKNRNFCEATTLYWMWKNYAALGNPDYIGFMQYRRHFILNHDYLAGKTPDKYNLIYNDRFNAAYQYDIGITDYNIQKLLEDHDAIFCVKDLETSIYEYKAGHHSQNIKFWDYVLEIIKKDWPKYATFAETFNKGKTYVWSNCFIMPKDRFLEYGNFLFDILFKVDQQFSPEYGHMTFEQRRVPAYVSETLLGVYYLYLKSLKLKIKSLPLVYTRAPYSITPKIYPLNKKNVIPIVFITDSTYFKYTSVAIESILLHLHNNYTYHFFILENGTIPQPVREVYRKKENSQCKFSFLDCTALMEKNRFQSFFSKRLDRICYLTLFLHQIFEEYGKVIYLDSDILVNQDISVLYTIDIGNKVLGAVRDYLVTSVQDNYFGRSRKYITTHASDFDIQDYVNSGVLLIDLTRLKDLANIDGSFIREANWSHPERKFNDQDVLNFVLHGKIFFMPVIYNYFVILQRKYFQTHLPVNILNEINSITLDEVVIYHFIGDYKPWNQASDTFPAYTLWWQAAKNSPFYKELLIDLFYNHTTSKPQDYANIVNSGLPMRISTRFIRFNAFCAMYYSLKILNKFRKNKYWDKQEYFRQRLIQNKF